MKYAAKKITQMGSWISVQSKPNSCGDEISHARGPFLFAFRAVSLGLVEWVSFVVIEEEPFDLVSPLG